MYLIVFLSSFSLNGNVAQSVERKSHNLKVVSSILTVPTFFAFVSSLPFVAFSLCFRLIYCMGTGAGGMPCSRGAVWAVAGAAGVGVLGPIVLL